MYKLLTSLTNPKVSLFFIAFFPQFIDERMPNPIHYFRSYIFVHRVDVAAETLRDFNQENDQQLAELVREMYRDFLKKEPGVSEEGCDGHQD